MAKFADRLITLGLTLIGIVIVVTPLALWVAWTETIFLVVLVTGATAAALYGVLARFERPPAQIEPSDSVRPVILPKNFLLELQRLHPFIHHHRPSGSPKLLTAMYHIKKFLYRGLG